MIHSQMLVYNLGLAMAIALNLTHVHTPLLSTRDAATTPTSKAARMSSKGCSAVRRD